MSLNETETLTFVLIICVQCFQKQPLQILFSPFVLYDGSYSSVYMINDFTHVAIYIHAQYSTCVCVCWGFTAQSTQWDHVERGQFT